MKFDKNIFKSLFKDQDSKYFIKNAWAITLVPIISFAVTFYSLWIFLDMNHSFFVSVGFVSGEAFKEALFDKLIADNLGFAAYFLGFIFSMFMVGLLISYFVMKPFKKIAKFFNQVEDIYEEELKFDGMSQKKLIVQAAVTLISYMKDPEQPKEELIPANWHKMKRPQPDYVFYFQYFCIMLIVTMMSAMSVYLLTNELHASIVQNAMQMLKASKAVSIFFEEQKGVLVSIYSTSIAISVVLYTLLAKKVISQVDGVSFGFYRDIKQIINGDHKKKLFPRFTDPGKNAANAINNFLDIYFSEYEEEVEEENVTPIQSAPKLMQAPPAQNEESAPVDLGLENNVSELRPKPPQDAPPVFIDKKEAVGGGTTYNIITPKGYKVENLGEDELVKVLKELELKDS